MHTLQELAGAARHLDEQATPRWGILTPQHMLEHLALSVRISNGRISARQIIAEAEIPARREFLLGDKPFPRLVKNPLMGEGLLPLRFSSLGEARQRFLSELAEFDSFHASQPGAAPVHPLFGPLTHDEWVRFHTKHFTHHFIQFGLL